MEKPAHVAIIMDGNGRWAKKRMLPRNVGHQKGADALDKLTRKMDKEGGFKQVTVFAFSTENWQRPKEEVDGLMDILRKYLKKFIADADKERMKLNILGDVKKLPIDIIKDIEYIENTTKNHAGLQVNMAINYGGRDEIIRMTKKLLLAYEANEISVSDIDEKVISSFLDTKGIEDPDLLIRTSGEQRLSNFLLWQMAYTELYFTDTLWPDFTYTDLMKAVKEYQQRQRRYGR